MKKTIQRKPQFRTQVVTFEDSQHKSIYKCPASELAKEFIKTIPEKEQANAEYVKDVFEVLNGTLHGSSIEYDYLPLPSVEDKVIECLQKRRIDQATKWLDDFIARINSLPVTKTLPIEFLTIIARSETCDFESARCLCPGLIDLIPRNVLCKNDNWIIIDNEWSFRFAVPVSFVIFRSIYSIAVLYQNLIRLNASRNEPAVVFFKSGHKTYYIPLKWSRFLTQLDIRTSTMLRWETAFQKYVTGISSQLDKRVPDRPQCRTAFFCTNLFVRSKLTHLSLLRRAEKRAARFIDTFCNHDRWLKP
ncbi:hypothetical protein [Anaerohalosphaera lusitana]|nr:hypothetical protein [Anaerohalosphaera lusitana]